MNHSGDANKMVGDTPRTDAAYFKPRATMYDLAGEMKRVERELNAANSEIERLRKANLQLREGAEEQKQRIKWLEEAGDAMADLLEGRAVTWIKSKEDKP